MKILPISMKTAKESSNPFFIELYTIWLTTGVIRLCNCDEVITFAGNDYSPVPIQRGTIKATVDSKVDNVELKIVDADNSKISALMSGFDFRGRYCEIDKILYPDSLTDPTAVVLAFYGYLDTPTYSNGEFTVTIKSSVPYIQSPTRITQYFCNSSFGDTECGMDKAKRTVNIDTVKSTANKIYITDTIDGGYYNSGLLTIGYETKWISNDYINEYGAHILETQFPFQGTIQATGTIERNCNKTPEMCKNQYNNRSRYSGFLAVPLEFRLS